VASLQVCVNMASCLPPYTEIDVGYSFEDLPWESFVKSVLELNKINHKVDQKQLTVSLDLMKHQLTHGDIVNMSNYRLIHAYVVYRLKPTDTPLLLKTYMEYGYGAPCDFSDAPRAISLELMISGTITICLIVYGQDQTSMMRL